MIKIKQREKILIIAAAGIIAAFLAQKFLFSGLKGKSRGIPQQVAVEEAKLKFSIDIQKKRDKIGNEYKEYKGYLEKVEGLSDREVFAKFLKEVEKIAQESGASIVNLNPQTEPEDVPDYRKYNAELRAEANIEQLFNFLNRVQTSGLLIKLDRLSLTPKDEQASSLRIEATISMTIPKS